MYWTVRRRFIARAALCELVSTVLLEVGERVLTVGAILTAAIVRVLKWVWNEDRKRISSAVFQYFRFLRLCSSMRLLY